MNGIHMMLQKPRDHCLLKTKQLLNSNIIFMSCKENPGQCLVRVIEITNLQGKSNMANHTDRGKKIFPAFNTSEKLTLFDKGH